jgi:putative ABC transport system ATP-binding protein
MDLCGESLVHGFGQGRARTFVLRDVSLELSRGAVTLLMGPSGSGKSTLLAILAGLARPDEGLVLALGRNLWAMSESERESFRRRYCGFVFQAHNLFPSLTAREQLEMMLEWGENCSASVARRRAEMSLDDLGLAGKGHLIPAQLSGGEKGRVAVARALIKHPAFCFADEPTASLDWTTGRQVVERLCRAARHENAMVLIVTHDHRLVPFADEVMSLDDGRLLKGDPSVEPGLPAVNPDDGIRNRASEAKMDFSKQPS